MFVPLPLEFHFKILATMNNKKQDKKPLFADFRRNRRSVSKNKIFQNLFIFLLETQGESLGLYVFWMFISSARRKGTKEAST